MFRGRMTHAVRLLLLLLFRLHSFGFPEWIGNFLIDCLSRFRMDRVWSSSSSSNRMGIMRPPRKRWNWAKRWGSGSRSATTRSGSCLGVAAPASRRWPGAAPGRDLAACPRSIRQPPWPRRPADWAQRPPSVRLVSRRLPLRRSSWRPPAAAQAASTTAEGDKCPLRLHPRGSVRSKDRCPLRRDSSRRRPIAARRPTTASVPFSAPRAFRRARKDGVPVRSAARPSRRNTAAPQPHIPWPNRRCWPARHLPRVQSPSSLRLLSSSNWPLWESAGHVDVPGRPFRPRDLVPAVRRHLAVCLVFAGNRQPWMKVPNLVSFAIGWAEGVVV